MTTSKRVWWGTAAVVVVTGGVLFWLGNGRDTDAALAAKPGLKPGTKTKAMAREDSQMVALVEAPAVKTPHGIETPVLPPVPAENAIPQVVPMETVRTKVVATQRKAIMPYSPEFYQLSKWQQDMMLNAAEQTGAVTEADFLELGFGYTVPQINAADSGKK